MKNKILLSLLLVNYIIFAQDIKSIQTDRPDQTETPALTPKKMFQVETGFTYEKTTNIQYNYLMPSILSKYGVSDNFEIRLITEFLSIKSISHTESGIPPVMVGFKARLVEEKGILPKTSFIGHVALPNFSSTKYKLDYLAPQFRLVMLHTLAEKFSLSYNLGAEWNGLTPEPTYIYTLATGYSITEKVGSYIELFGFAPQNQKSNHNFDGGFTYLISNNAMIDVSGGFGLTENAPEYYYSIGFSFRI